MPAPLLESQQLLYEPGPPKPGIKPADHPAGLEANQVEGVYSQPLERPQERPMKQPLERPMKQPQERPQEWPMKQPRQRPRRDHPTLRGAGRQSRWSG